MLALLALLHAGPALAGADHHSYVYGYLPYWEYGPSRVPWEYLTHLAIFSVGANSDGSLSSTANWTSRAAEAVDLGHANGVSIHLCVTNFDSASQHSILSSPANRQRLVDALADQVHAYGADGVNVDFEGLDAQDKDAFVTFIQELKAAVDEVWIAMPAIDWWGSYDYDRLSAEADGLFIMGYEFYGTWGDPGPNAPLFNSPLWGTYAYDWVVDDYLAYGATLDKLVMGLPTYGHEWEVAAPEQVPTSATGGAWTMLYRDCADEFPIYGRNYDTDSDTPWYATPSTQVWCDDAESLGTRMEWLIWDAGLAGIGFWALGYDDNDPELWDRVAENTMVQDRGTTGGATGGTTGGATGGTTGDDPAPPPSGRAWDRVALAGGCAAAPLAGGGWALALAALGALRRRRYPQ